jgi:hypothetical protein
VEHITVSNEGQRSKSQSQTQPDCRGRAQLKNGKAIIELPQSFQTPQDNEVWTINITAIDGYDRLTVKTQNGHPIKNGRFIITSDKIHSNQQFYWEVRCGRSSRRESMNR